MPLDPAHTAQFILAQCHLAGELGRFIFGNHALDRMKQRNATRGDVRCALTTATLATFQADNGRWKITGGTDRSGDALEMAVVFENGLVVITVF
ncbi:MAG: hypothetical protein RL033_5410 [Pseudomonadota bacterium]